MKEICSDKETKKWRATGSFEPKAASVRVSIYLVLVVVLVSQNKSFLKILFVASSSIISYIQPALKQSPPRSRRRCLNPLLVLPAAHILLFKRSALSGPVPAVMMPTWTDPAHPIRLQHGKRRARQAKMQYVRAFKRTSEANVTSYRMGGLIERRPRRIPELPNKLEANS